MTEIKEFLLRSLSKSTFPSAVKCINRQIESQWGRPSDYYPLKYSSPYWKMDTPEHGVSAYCLYADDIFVLVDHNMHIGRLVYRFN